MTEVTVIMSAYNAMPYLPEAVESILNQTVKDLQYLIINDGSSDGSEEYLNQLNDPRIKVFHRPHHGQGASRNFGLSKCDTEFVAIMDADDLSLPSRLESQLCFLHYHREVALVGTQFAYLGIGGRMGLSPHMPCDHETIYADLLRGRHGLVNATIMCRTSILKKTGGYRIKACGEVWDMFLRMGEVSRLANLNEMLYLYRVHSGSVNVKRQAQIRMQSAYANCCAKRRAESRPEPSFEKFLEEHRARPFWKHIMDAMDVYALSQYRLALADILDLHPIKGYTRLGWAAICSPRWTAQRISRTIRKHSNS